MSETPITQLESTMSAAYQQGDLGRALQASLAILQQSPDHHAAHLITAKIRQAQGLYGLARNHAEASHKSNPLDIESIKTDSIQTDLISNMNILNSIEKQNNDNIILGGCVVARHILLSQSQDHMEGEPIVMGQNKYNEIYHLDINKYSALYIMTLGKYTCIILLFFSLNTKYSSK